MQRYSLGDQRDTNASVIRTRRSSHKVLDDLDGESANIPRGIAYTRTIEIKGSTTQEEESPFHASAKIDETGEFDSLMNEWTVYFLWKDHPSPCSVDTLHNLEIRVGDQYDIDFVRDECKVHARMNNAQTPGEKSLLFTIGNELMLMARITGCPEERSATDDDDTVYDGDLPNLLRMLQSEEMEGTKMSFGCIIFKDFHLKDLCNVEEEGKNNWETFE